MYEGKLHYIIKKKIWISYSKRNLTRRDSLKPFSNDFQQFQLDRDGNVQKIHLAGHPNPFPGLNINHTRNKHCVFNFKSIGVARGLHPSCFINIYKTFVWRTEIWRSCADWTTSIWPSFVSLFYSPFVLNLRLVEEYWLWLVVEGFFLRLFFFALMTFGNRAIEFIRNTLRNAWIRSTEKKNFWPFLSINNINLIVKNAEISCICR